MTDSDDTQRPVSVAELLARNGAADGKISGHRRRMRGNADAIPVAELTGEIPVIRDKKGGRARPNPAPSPAPETAAPPESPKASEAGARSYLRSNEDALFGGDSMADEAARRGTTAAPAPAPAQPSSMESPLRSIFPPTPTPVARPGEPRKSIDFNDATGVISPVTAEPPKSEPAPAPAAVAPAVPAAPPAPEIPVPPVSRPEPESVTPEPVAPEPEPEPAAVAQPEPEPEPVIPEPEPSPEPETVYHAEYEAEYEDDGEYDEYGRAVEWTSHDAEQDVEDDEFNDQEDDYQLEHELQELVGAHGDPSEPEVSQLAAADTDKSKAEAKADRREKIKTYLQGSWIAAQYLLAAAAGAGLFFVFRELWSWNQGFALLLGVLFIAILVASLWVIRKTVDLASILIAIVVGALIAFGPLVLMLQAVD
ncbi:hypothetical protein [Mycobacteroides chelonae]|jgi:hypothetical protein|uniref:Transmembrane protein n=1 Tax=Mycobacteroides chelonae TaxID=1774 RepID=A0AB73LH01_MYCCH|nr:hypothetical protein [Mycobacteroides chelonae]SKL96301.1 transmembrane protein [Mycobacteroides abscessus subsp. bolletii]MBF9325408.1 hypothetical protein [Mycobacteroides chelonae]MBF9419584.1 hypothetical protein [Mycobacteroides chelonae]MBF9438066.1 hypothetical protein [Mycobacteroides chelonae]MBV6359368.1 hypothetical protein [Mycobacteroides chelonae]